MGYSSKVAPLPEGPTVGVTFIAASLYGSFLILFILSSLVLHRQNLANKKQVPGSHNTLVYLILGYILFLTVSSNWIILWLISVHPSLGGGAGNSTIYSAFLYIQNVAEAFAAVVADWILLYRLYVIWNRKRAILVGNATIFVLQAVICICYSIYYARQRMIWMAGSLVLVILTLSTHIGATALIAWKLWSVNRHYQTIGSRKILNRVIAIIVESAAMYTTYMIVYLILFLIKRGASSPLLYCLPSVAGIATTLVNVRVGLGWAAGERGRSTWSLRDSFIDNDCAMDHANSFEGRA